MIDHCRSAQTNIALNSLIGLSAGSQNNSHSTGKRPHNESCLIIGLDQAIEVEQIVNGIDNLKLKMMAIGIETGVKETDVALAFKELARIINGWLDLAINANIQGLDFMLSSQIRIDRVVDCLISGLCLQSPLSTITILA